jgi:hypothetical protein
MLFLIKSKYEKKLSKEERQKAVQKTIDSDYPVLLIITFSSLKIAIGLTLVVLQALCFYYETILYKVSPGYF